ncbi:MAG: hypothetical protein IH965_00765 [Gemmatimonadetes bacterium]|nr:hypothetical protein [Gemmatimonadota bacterium]
MRRGFEYTPHGIGIFGLDDPAFEEQLRRRIPEHKLFLALYLGCAVPSRAVPTLSS